MVTLLPDGVDITVAFVRRGVGERAAIALLVG
jgi:hypothetical protein